jgi:hypothetical protein
MTLGSDCCNKGKIKETKLMRKWFLAAVMIVAASSFANARETDQGHLFAQVPTPPKTCAAAVSQVTIAGASHLSAATPAYDAVIRAVQEQAKTSDTAGGQQQADRMGLGIDVQRMQNDPAYAAKMQEKMANMSVGQKLATAQKWMAAENGQGRSMSAQMAHGRVMTYIGQKEPVNNRALAGISELFRKTIKASQSRHDAVDRKIEAALEKCPTDNTGLEKVWSCARPLEDRAVREHRAAEKASLAEEDAAYRKAWKTAKARIDDMLPVLAMAKQGGDAEDVATISSDIGRFTWTLAVFGRSVTLRAAFWGEPGLSVALINETEPRFSVKMGHNREVDWPGTDNE